MVQPSIIGNARAVIITTIKLAYNFFRGYRILNAIIENLKARGMSAATDVILTGCSGES